MTYPALEAVESASVLELARWYRFLPLPGTKLLRSGKKVTKEDRAIGEAGIKKESAIFNRIEERFKEMGGMTMELSKQIGWEEK